MSETKITLPSGGGAYERRADGSLELVEAPTAPAGDHAEDRVEAPAEARVQAPVEGPVKATPKRSVKEG